MTWTYPLDGIHTTGGLPGDHVECEGCYEVHAYVERRCERCSRRHLVPDYATGESCLCWTPGALCADGFVTCPMDCECGDCPERFGWRPWAHANGSDDCACCSEARTCCAGDLDDEPIFELGDQPAIGDINVTPDRLPNEWVDPK